MNYIEQLLEKMTDIEAKAQFNGLLEKHAFIADYIVDPEVKLTTDKIKNWAETEWDYEHESSIREYQQQQEIQRLTEAGSKKMKASELEDLDAVLGQYIKDKGLITKTEYDAAIKEKETFFAQQLDITGRLAARVPYLNAKHQQEFGNMFDPDDYIKKAVDGGFANSMDGLDRFYDTYTKDAQSAKATADLERIRKEAHEAGAKEARDQMIANAGRGTQEVDGSPELSHFQQKIMKLGQQEAPKEGQSAAPPDAELGKGVISRFAALRGDALERAGGRVQ